ncbi:DUF6327 family protein [Flavobacterium faecale]|uniref:DUF6327 family protein n=1 Tax=Flavobacterium faecale TaxID=1355330 RepID=UPI003AAD0EBC
MEKKIYSSFEQIEVELEILSIEREINHQKIVLALQKTRDQFTPVGFTKNVFSLFKNVLSGSNSTIYKLAIPLIIKWILNKKRSR